nr:hypothetical protein CFP56_30874 [Quercus suber]
MRSMRGSAQRYGCRWGMLEGDIELFYVRTREAASESGRVNGPNLELVWEKHASGSQCTAVAALLFLTIGVKQRRQQWLEQHSHPQVSLLQFMGPLICDSYRATTIADSEGD